MLKTGSVGVYKLFIMHYNNLTIQSSLGRFSQAGEENYRRGEDNEEKS